METQAPEDTCVVGRGDTFMHIHTHGMWPFTHIPEVSNPCGHTHFVLVHGCINPRGGDSPSSGTAE